jgi:ABC-type sugar transport system substrate-binding protein
MTRLFRASPLAILLVFALLVATAGCGDDEATPTTAPATTTTAGATTTTAAVGELMAHTSTGKVVPQGVTDPPLPEVTADSAYKIGVQLPDIKDPFFLALLYGYYSEADRLGVELTLLESGGYGNIDTQISQVEDLIQMGLDGILVNPADSTAIIPVMERGADAGIPMMSMLPIETDKILGCRAMSSHYGLGYAMGQWLVDNIGEGTIVAQPGPPGAFWATDRYEGFEDAVAQDPDFNILDVKWTDSDRNAGMTTTEDYLQRFPDVDIIYTGSDFQGSGAADAIAAAGLAGQVVNITAVLGTDAERYLREGNLSMVEAQQTILLGAGLIRMLVYALNGNTCDFTVEIPTMSVTTDNVDQVILSYVRPPDTWRPDDPTAPVGESFPTG